MTTLQLYTKVGFNGSCPSLKAVFGQICVDVQQPALIELTFPLEILQGARVWIRDDVLVWIGGELKKDFDGDSLEIELEDGKVSRASHASRLG